MTRFLLLALLSLSACGPAVEEAHQHGFPDCFHDPAAPCASPGPP